MERLDGTSWDEWWQRRLSEGRAGLFPVQPAPLFGFQDAECPQDVVNSDDVLVAIMAKHGLGSVLCAGNGVSQEPRGLAAAGLNVTALDISPVAVRVAREFQIDSRGLCHFCRPELHRPGGHAKFVIGDLLDTEVCPGPFDVVIERLTVQTFAETKRPTVLEALSERLSPVGIFLSHCLDDPFPSELGWAYHETGLFHASESWFRDQGWTIWDVAPGSTLTGRVAWLIRSGSMKPRPSRKEEG